MIDDFIKKLPDKIYFYNSKHIKKPDDEMQVNFIPIHIASSFAVLRDQVIRHLDPNGIK